MANLADLAPKVLGWMALGWGLAVLAAPAADARLAGHSVEWAPGEAAVSLAVRWKFRPGDEAAWARPEYDDSGWREIAIPTGFGRRDAEASIAWYRLTVRLAPGSRSDLGLGLTLGGVDSAYQVYAGGILLGGVGAFPPSPRLDYDRHGTYPVPVRAIGEDGRLVIALRVWKSPETRSDVGGPVEGPFLLGRLEDLTRRQLVADLPELLLAAIFLLVGLYHLELFRRRPRLRGYLWLAGATLCFAVYTFLRTQWKYALTDHFVVLKEIEHLTIYLILASFIQVLWPLLGLRIGPLLRAGQGLAVAAGALVAATPGLELNLLLLPFFQLAVLAVIATGVLAIFREAWRRHPEARIVAIGAILCAAAYLNDMVIDRGFWLGPRLIAFGFGAFVLSLAISLANRFERIHQDLEELERLYSLTQDLLCVAGADGYFERINPAFSRTLGYPAEELLARPAVDFVHPEDRARTRERLAKLIRGETPGDFENRYRCRDGSYRWLAWRSIGDPEQGLIYAIARDITDKRRAREALRRSQANLAEAQQLAHLGSWDYSWEADDPTVGELSWSRELYRIFGLDPDRLPPALEDFWTFAHPADRGLVESAFDQALRQGTALDLEYRIVRLDGGERVIHAQAGAAAGNPGEGWRTTGSALDVTERIRAKKALERASRARSEFLANMSHEIRTPMNAIIGMTRFLRKADLPPREQTYAENIKTSADGLLQIIDDILDFSKIEAGKLRVETTDFPLRRTLDGVMVLLAPRARRRGIELRSAVAETVPDGLRGDPMRLRQVLLNLVGNAIKFTDQGSVEVGVEVAGGEDAVRIRFAVRDTGIGIPPEVQGQLFTPFTQADSSTTRNYGGTGLGLAISQRIVGLMGGKIELESAPRAGSTFSFTLPFERSATPPEVLQAQAEDREADDAPAPAAGRADRQSYRVLVAEDEELNRLVALRQLEELGFGVAAVANGRQALAALERERFDLVLMDCQMPDLDGYETTRRLRRGEANRRHLPVIAMTAHAMHGEREKCLAAGMDDYIAKPFKERQLARLLDHWLGVRPAAAVSEAEPDAGTPAAGTPEAPLVDGETIAQLRRSGPSFLERMIGIFLDQGPPKLEAMGRAVDSGDLETLATTAHALMGTAGMVGAHRLSELSRRLEAAAASGADCRAPLRQVERGYDQAAVELKELLG